jgi:hypothetical protein
MRQVLELTKAAGYLKISRRKLKLWSLAKEGIIEHFPDLLDKRKKLFRVADMRRLKEASNGHNN